MFLKADPRSTGTARASPASVAVRNACRERWGVRVRRVASPPSWSCMTPSIASGHEGSDSSNFQHQFDHQPRNILGVYCADLRLQDSYLHKHSTTGTARGRHERRPRASPSVTPATFNTDLTINLNHLTIKRPRASPSVTPARHSSNCQHQFDHQTQKIVRHSSIFQLSTSSIPATFNPQQLSARHSSNFQHQFDHQTWKTSVSRERHRPQRLHAIPGVTS